MKCARPVNDDRSLRYFIGDIRDQQRLRRLSRRGYCGACRRALKQVRPANTTRWKPSKPIILGSSNVIEAALDAGVTKVIALSTDKAVNPVNLYGLPNWRPKNSSCNPTATRAERLRASAVCATAMWSAAAAALCRFSSSSARMGLLPLPTNA